MSNKEHFDRGSTALPDAAGTTTDTIAAAQRNTAEEHRAEKALFVIITGGMERSGTERSAEHVRRMIARGKGAIRPGGRFLGGENMDVVQTAASFGISADRAADSVPDAQGTRPNCQAMAHTVACCRATGAVPKEYMNEIGKDMKKRGRRT